MSTTRMEAFSEGVIAKIDGALYVIVAIMWLVPDRRIEKTLVNETR